jgi:hypothetical protein
VVLVASGMVLMLLFQSLFWPDRGLFWRAIGPTRAKVQPASEKKAAWGEIDYTSIALDRPEEYFAQDITNKVRTAWVFRDHSEQQLSSLFSSLGLSGTTLSQLTNRVNWELLPRAIRVWPPPQAVAEMEADARKALYKLLAQNPENALQTSPFRFRADGFDDWFANCGLSKQKIDLVRNMAYVDGASLCFADAPTFAQLSTPEETMALIKCLWRVSTFVMKVRIHPETDVDAVVKYWGAFGAGKAYKPLIESMSRVQAGSSINVSYFLPAFARLRLYTYPDPRDTNILRQDCFWTAMNFFNAAPDNGFFDSAYTKKILATDYNRLSDSSRQFGDLLLLLGHDNQALHMCVYLADGVVFTKNGANTQQPWVLMRMSEMLGEYEKQRPFEIVVYRRKTPPKLSSAVHFSSAINTL